MSRSSVLLAVACFIGLAALGCSKEDEDPSVAPPRVTIKYLPDGRVGVAYSVFLQASSGETPYTWSIFAGSLPGGLSLSASTGEISGTPTTVEFASFTARVADAGGRTGDRALSITIRPAAAPTYPRLLVASGGAISRVKIWNNADAIAADRAADATLGGLVDIPLAMALHLDRLFVACTSATDPVYIWDNASTLADGSVNDDTLSVAAFNGTPLSMVFQMFVDSAATLWISYSSVRLFPDAGNLTNASMSQAQLTESSGAGFVLGMASDVPGNKLVGGCGAGAVAWNNPTAKTGEINDYEWTLFLLPANHMTITTTGPGGDRLYAASISAVFQWGHVNIWHNISAASSSRAPTITMGTGSNLDQVWHVQVKNDVLVATVANGPIQKVNIYTGASTLSGETVPDFEITNAAMDNIRKAHLAEDDRLYVLDSDGVLIFDRATTGPTFVCEIQTDVGMPMDFMILE
ncbi:MAG: Ig domain-containing protein [Planctomycetota bacterium]|jgi:hypothetical protein